jgi:cysteine desulfurase
MSTATATKEDTTDISAPGFSIKGNALAGRAAYLDFQATTPMDPRVLDAMLPYMTELYGNPHSRTHTYGWETEKAVEDARENVANLIGATSKEIIFTSGATESNNMAIKGVARFYGEHKKHLITTQTEHKCVLDSFRALQSEGFEVTYLPVQTNGLIDLDQLKAALRPETVLVSIMGVNNEIGVIQPLKEISKVSNAFRYMYPLRVVLNTCFVVLNTCFVQLCKANKTFLHSDIAQMAGKVPVDVNELGLDLASISSHKVQNTINSLLGLSRQYTVIRRRSGPRHVVRHVTVCQRVH